MNQNSEKKKIMLYDTFPIMPHLGIEKKHIRASKF